MDSGEGAIIYFLTSITPVSFWQFSVGKYLSLALSHSTRANLREFVRTELSRLITTVIFGNIPIFGSWKLRAQLTHKIFKPNAPSTYDVVTWQIDLRTTFPFSVILSSNTPPHTHLSRCYLEEIYISLVMITLEMLWGREQNRKKKKRNILLPLNPRHAQTSFFLQTINIFS